MRPWFLGASGLIAGIAAHLVWAEVANSSPALQSITREALTVTQCKPDSEHLHRVVQRAVHEAIRPSAPNALAESLRTGVIVAPASVEETDDNHQARAEQKALVEAAVRAGRWTEDDVLKLRAILPRISETERPRVLVEISQAIDQHRLRVEASVRF
jgi:hypothetical protein